MGWRNQYFMAAMGGMWLVGSVCSASEGPPTGDDIFASADRFQVTDGDTVRFSHLGESHRIRLKGINAPEKGECLATEATEAMRGLMSEGLRVERQGTDRYGRWLAYLWTPEGRLVQLALVERGLALANDYGDPDAHSGVLTAAQQQAQERGVGMFSATACGASTGLDVRIVAMDPNPEGDDLQPGAGESVTLAGPPGARLGGWMVKDLTASNRLPFPEGTRLDDEGRLRVYSSCGASSVGVYFACAKGSAIWNNTGDTAFLLDPNGNLVSSEAWRP